MRSALRSTSLLVFLYACWLGMEIVHEFGHILHARLSGGHLAQVRIPLFGFSETIIWPNPRERFVVWGGPIWGSLIPLLMCGLLLLARRRVPHAMRCFAGFCLIANGAYLGVG